MAFKLKRHRKSKNKSKLLARLKELKAKKSLTSKEKVEMDKILSVLDKKRTNKIESKKDEIAKVIYNGDSDLSDLTIGHVTSAAGQYRKGRIANFKN